MDTALTHRTLNLTEEGLLSIRDGQAARIRCNEGMLWITEEGEIKDTILAAGESYTIRHPGLALLTALGVSRVTIEGPAKHVRTGRTARPHAVLAYASCA